LSWRIARQQPWIGGRSECPSCQTKLAPLDLIPLFSWLALRGRCRHCRAAIGIRYPLIELAVLSGCLGVYAAWHFTISAFIIMAALPFLMALFVVDVEQMILPDRILAILAFLGLIFILSLVFPPNLSLRPSRLIAAHGGGSLAFALLVWGAGKVVTWRRKREALGFGDVKFFAIAGLWLGIAWLPFFMIMSGMLGLAWGGAWRLMSREGPFPFGPALILAFYGCLLWAGPGFSGFLNINLLNN
jgi:leader peptidase (prepilin peptidase)/N-methyltransferase